MKKFFILIPVFNDWKSVFKLLNEIDDKIKNWEEQVSVLIINDASIETKPNVVLNFENFKFIKLINMKENRGHARCNAFGLRYINSKEIYDYVLIMDSDGEDRPVEIKDLINKIEEIPDISVVARRVKRSEGAIFQSLYQVHKIITFFFTGKKINFGNYSCLTKEDTKILSDKSSLWSSFSGSLMKHLKNLNGVNSFRGLRYYGPSKMSLLNLILHSFSIIAVFKYTVFLRTTLMIILMSFFVEKFGSIIIAMIMMLVFFNLIIFLVSMRENERALFESNNNILNENEITH